MKRLGLLLLAMALVVVSCSASDDDAGSDVESTEIIETTTTTEDTTTTTEQTTTTTAEPEPDLEADVEAAYFRSHEVWTECHLMLPDCDVATALAEVFTGGSYDRLTEATLARQADGLVYEAPDIEEHSRTEVFDVNVEGSQLAATVTYCTYSGGKELLVGPDGTRVPVGLNNTVVVAWGTARFLLEDDGEWRIEDLVGDSDSPKNVLIEDVDRLRAEGELCGGR